MDKILSRASQESLLGLLFKLPDLFMGFGRIGKGVQKVELRSIGFLLIEIKQCEEGYPNIL